MFFSMRNLNEGKRNPRVHMHISGQGGGDGTIGPSVFVCIGHYGIYQGVGFHTTIHDAIVLRAHLDEAIAIASKR